MKPRLLVCDDTPTVLDFLELVFEKQGFTVLRTASGEAAVALARDEKPDLILIDAMMPGIDGFDVCRRLRRDARTQSATILMYSAIVGEEVQAKARAAGADEFLGKTMHQGELVAHVRDWLATKSGPGAVGDQTWRQAGLDLLTLFHTDLVWILTAQDGITRTRVVASAFGEQQARRFVQALGEGPFETGPGSLVGEILASNQLRLSWDRKTLSRLRQGEWLDTALKAAGLQSISASPLRVPPRLGVVCCASPAELASDARAVAEWAIGLRYAESILGREDPAPN